MNARAYFRLLVRRKRKPKLQVGDRVALPGVKYAIYGRLVDIWDGQAVVSWDNGVLRDNVALHHLEKASPSDVHSDTNQLAYPPDLDVD